MNPIQSSGSAEPFGRSSSQRVSRSVSSSSSESMYGSGGIMGEQRPSGVVRAGGAVLQFPSAVVSYGVTGNLAHAVAVMQAVGEPVAVEERRPALRVVIKPETAFYRKYTEGMLRRYGVMALQKGRVPSLLGRELFRGKVTSYKVHGFDDVVIFVHDVEKCLKLLNEEQRRLVYRIGVQEYTFGEAAAMLRWSLRSTKRRYNEAVDELTAIFQQRGLMEKMPGLGRTERCQEGEAGEVAVSYSPGMSCA